MALWNAKNHVHQIRKNSSGQTFTRERCTMSSMSPATLSYIGKRSTRLSMQSDTFGRTMDGTIAFELSTLQR